MENIICGYDGFKLFIPGEGAIKQILKRPDDFNLHGRYSVNTNKKYELPLKGEYGTSEYKLKVTATVYNGLGPGVEIKGSFHKFFTGGENHSIFYWSQFTEAIATLCKIFNVDPIKVHVINLELGFNISIPEDWRVNAKDIIRNILAFKGSSFKDRTDINHNKNGYFLQFSLSQYLLKIYDKAMQNNLPDEQILRYEIKVLKSAFLHKLMIKTLADLASYHRHQALAFELSELFDHLIIYQPHCDELIVVPGKLPRYGWEYGKPEIWERLHVQNRHRYKYLKKKLEGLIEKSGVNNYKKELQQLIIAATDPVPEIPL